MKKKKKSKRKLGHPGLMTVAVRIEIQPSDCIAMTRLVTLCEGKGGFVALFARDGHMRNVQG